MVDTELQICIKAKIHQALDWNKETIPFSKPIHLRSKHLDNIRNNSDYVVCEHKQGIRAFIYHGKEGFFWYGPDGSIRNLHLHNIPISDTEGRFTIVEAIWVASEKTFYIMDAPIVFGNILFFTGVTQRINHFHYYWFNHYSRDFSDQFVLKLSDWVSASLISSLDHQNGILITSAFSFYTCGKNQNMWLWTDPSTLSMCFRFRFSKVDDPTSYCLLVADQDSQKEIVYWEGCDPHQGSIVNITDGQLVDCEYMPECRFFNKKTMSWNRGLWRPKKVRTEKKQAINLTKICSTMRLLEENITFDALNLVFKEFYEFEWLE